MDLILFYLYILGLGCLGYFLCSAVYTCSINLKPKEKMTVFSIKRKEIFLNEESSLNLLVCLDKQLKELDLQVLPKKIGNFNNGEIQSLIDNSIVGSYEFIEYKNGNGVYTVSIKDDDLGNFSTTYNVKETPDNEEVPDAISKMLFEEYMCIAGRQAQKSDHYFFKDNGVEAATGIVLAKKKFIIEHNMGNDRATKCGRKFVVNKNDLLIPIRNIHKKFMTYLVVDSSKAKNVRIASSIKGGFFPIGEFPHNHNDYILCEDYLTGSTLHRATNKTVLVCFDVQNIGPVAKSILLNHTNANLIFATSKDIMTKNQARIRKGLWYAKEFNMPFILPIFPEGKKYAQYKSWNELQNFKSDNEIKSIIDKQTDFFTRNGKMRAIEQVAKKYNLI